MTPCTRIVAVITLIVLSGTPLAAQTPAGTAFTYQGRLTDAGNPATGAYDLQFTLYDAAVGGNTIGSSVTHTSAAVTGGIFSVLLDFGASAFTGGARWLQVAVRPGGASSAFTAISPRQQITPTPYALDAQRLGGQLPAAYQARVSGTCSTGSIITAIAADGAVSCAQINGADIVGQVPNTVTPAQLATELGPLETAIVTLQSGKQARVSGTCSAGSSIRVVAEDGSVTCQPAGSIPASVEACGAENTGSLRYVSAMKRLDLCDGTAWRELRLALEYGHFYLLSPPDAAAPIAAGGAVPFPRAGPVSGIVQNSATEFNLAAVGVYEVTWQVSINEPGQLGLALNGVTQAPTIFGRAAGSSQIVGKALIETAATNTVLTVRNPAGSPAALTVTPMAGGSEAVAGSLVIKRIR